MMIRMLISLIFSANAQTNSVDLPPCTGEETKTTKCALKVTYRDFQAESMANAPSKKLPDFQSSSVAHGYIRSMVKDYLNPVTHKPELSDNHRGITSAETFAAWYDECAGPAGPGLTCGATRKQCMKSTPNDIPCGYSYKFDSVIAVEYDQNTKKYALQGPNFFPLDTGNCPGPLVDGRCGWGNQPTGFSNNFAFTTEMNLLFKFKGGETFRFSGDDDVWVFIGSRLLVDIGGLHPELCLTLALPQADCESDCEAVTKTCDDGAVQSRVDVSFLKVGQTYRFDLFHAERHTHQSNFKFETTLDLRADTCKDFLQQLKDGTYTSPELQTGLLVTDESCPAEKFQFEDSKESSFCDVRACRPGYEPVGSNYLRLVCDGDMLRTYGKGFKCTKIVPTSSTAASSDTDNSAPTTTTTAATTTTTTTAAAATTIAATTTTTTTATTTAATTTTTTTSLRAASTTTPIDKSPAAPTTSVAREQTQMRTTTVATGDDEGVGLVPTSENTDDDTDDNTEIATTDEVSGGLPTLLGSVTLLTMSALMI